MSVSESGVEEAPRPRRGRPPSVGLAERRREQLTDAAFTVFAEQGYEQASVADIAKRAGMGQGTLYRYVEGKRELLDLVFDRCVDELMTAIAPDRVVEVSAGGDLEATERMVEDVAARLFDLVDSRPDILKVVMVQSGTVDEELRFRIQGLYQTFDGMMGRALGHARERGWIVTRTEDPEAETVQLGRLLPALGVPGLVMALTGADSAERRQAYVRSAVRMSASGILADDARSTLPVLAPSGEGDSAPEAPQDTVAGRSAELLDAAIAEFVEKGYAAVGVREITERAGVSHGTFYNYFDSKRHMLTVLVERSREGVLGRLDAVVADPPAGTVEALQAAVFELNRDVLQDVAARLDEFRFLALEVPGVDVEAFDTYLALYREATSRFVAILSGASAAGLVHESLDVGDIAEVWLGYMLGAAAAMVSDVDVTSPAESARVVTNLLLGGARTE
ncbi:HTH-type transcriptional repressor KstR2 (plasmid) [Tsukamurella tyrosinosolvens]|uniref:DNA-binding transcriptional regulator, AcrR family n=1 Tax=Tsukamurella tyrosinosolvens TaxID=57704 RepID=A0A1H5AQI2_TSUTY|nr:TetR/AcrR family transcriptional regulator [Tsukamurella tyrosinosolvens]SED44502.1 DNA-binding transcriptional regulator, AcrR family [Tsukamurella tyrosinosolvens]VEI01339.1 HTH-type transcriptional repressor KstR2 [Tsukamurella tyrosinosolvens]